MTDLSRLRHADRPAYEIVASGCWMWLGHINNKGYGKKYYRGRHTQSHRAFYLEFVGEVPEGMQLDHLCRVRACCNPAHLEAVTPSTNVRRGDGPNLSRLRLTRFTAEQKNGAVDRVATGESMGAVARELGTATGVVHRWVKASGIPYTPRKSRYS